jgi:radical SAM superfamily enzyme YgiQ (UPF0313 family)
MQQTDCLLVFPPISTTERYSTKTEDIGGHLPPLGIASVAAMLEKHGFFVKILDAAVEKLTIQQTAQAILKENPKVLGLSCLTMTFEKCKKIATEIKKKNKKILIVIGGHHASIEPEKIMKNNCFDLLAFGEAETTILEILQKFKKNKKLLENKKQLSSIQGIVFRDGKKIIKTNARAPIENLDSLPWPARHLLPMKKYLPLANQYKRKPVTNIIAIRGCPFECTYCSSHSMFGRKIRFRSPENVTAEIKHLIEKYGIKELSFWDDTLTINKQWLEKLCDLIIKNKLDITWSCYGRVNTVDLQLLKKMKKAGCWNIFYGLESGNQELLEIIKKRTTLGQIKNAIKWTKQAGIESRGSFMIALPGETPEMAHKTIQFAIDLDLDYAQFCITTPFPGTELFETAKKFGKLEKKLSKYNIWEPVFIPFGYKNKKQIEEINKEAFRRFYFRPKYIIKRLLAIRSIEDIKRNITGLKMLLGIETKD